MTPAEIMAESRKRAANPQWTNDPWWTVDEIAKDFRVSRMTVHRAKNNGHLRFVKAGRLVRVRNSWYEAWVAAGAKTGATQ